MQFFHLIQNLGDIPKNGHFEKGFCFLILVISQLFENEMFLFFIVGSFVYASFLIFIFNNLKFYSYKNWIFSIIGFVLYGTYFCSTNLMRQYIAISIILLSYKYLYQKSYLKYYMLVLLATSFHSSSFICFILPLLHRIDINRNS